MALIRSMTSAASVVEATHSLNASTPRVIPASSSPRLAYSPRSPSRSSDTPASVAACVCLRISAENSAICDLAPENCAASSLRCLPSSESADIPVFAISRATAAIWRWKFCASARASVNAPSSSPVSAPKLTYTSPDIRLFLQN